MGKVPVISHRRNFFPSFTNFTSYNGSHTWCMAMMSAEDFVLPHFYAFCQPFLSRWLLLFNSQPIVYFFHYVAVFAELRRFHGSHLPIQMNWWDWCNKNCGAKKKSRGSFFSLHIFCFSEKNMENHHRTMCSGVGCAPFLRIRNEWLENVCARSDGHNN